MTEQPDLPPEPTHEPSTGERPAKRMPKRVYIWIGLLVVMVGLWGLTLPAKGKRDAAMAKIQDVDESGYEPPLVYMKAIGKTPMVKRDKKSGELVQVYRWPGGINTYELRITFEPLDADLGEPGIYLGNPKIVTTSKPFFMAESMEGFELAKKNTGSTFDKLPDPIRGSSPPSSELPAKGSPDFEGGKRGRRPGDGKKREPSGKAGPKNKESGNPPLQPQK